jgi:hypothetical protein
MSHETLSHRIDTRFPFQKNLCERQGTGQGTDFHNDAPHQRRNVKESRNRAAARPKSAEDHPQDPRQVDHQYQVDWQEPDSNQGPEALTIIS